MNRRRFTRKIATGGNNLAQRFAIHHVLAALAILITPACDSLLTEPPPAGDDFESPFDDLPEDLARMFQLGDENFEHAFIVAEGLGPIFNNMSCSGCHPGDGRGAPAQALVRFSLGSDLLLSLGGPQLQDRAIPGQVPESLPAGVETSLRLPPPVFGVGLIESIPVSTLIALADSADSDGDGISGRINWVTAGEFVPEHEVGGGAGARAGRFGRKANVSSLLEQVSTAYHQDMGITSDFLPVENPHPQRGGTSTGDEVADPEIPSNIVQETTVYVRLLKPPDRGPTTQAVRRGEAIFEILGCASCHIPSLTTGPSLIEALDQVEVPLYSDLLLHDMGPALADQRPDGSATGTEWRTAPLWGTRIAGDFIGGKPFYLHDGRTSSLSEAISLHGGEAAQARDAFLALPAHDRDALIRFLESL